MTRCFEPDSIAFINPAAGVGDEIEDEDEDDDVNVL
jgi:hypothetical protein